MKTFRPHMAAEASESVPFARLTRLAMCPGTRGFGGGGDGAGSLLTTTRGTPSPGATMCFGTAGFGGGGNRGAASSFSSSSTGRDSALAVELRRAVCTSEPPFRTTSRGFSGAGDGNDVVSREAAASPSGCIGAMSACSTAAVGAATDNACAARDPPNAMQLTAAKELAASGCRRVGDVWLRLPRGDPKRGLTLSRGPKRGLLGGEDTTLKRGPTRGLLGGEGADGANAVGADLRNLTETALRKAVASISTCRRNASALSVAPPRSNFKQRACTSFRRSSMRLARFSSSPFSLCAV
mmetsp:Transcript_43104/g.89748  ORF Transcript_43104/g.89748 Transcript_43104/m.89748 type:complete len:296 (-) Transcript_43104:246-1133(-)